MTIFYLLVITYLLLLSYVFYKNIKFGIYWIILTLPVYQIRFPLFCFPTTLLEMEILFLILLFLLKNRIKLKKYLFQLKKIAINNKLFAVGIFLFLISASLSVCVSPNALSAAGIWKAYFIEPFIFFIICILVLEKKDLKQISWLLAVQIFIMGSFAVYQKITGNFIYNEFWEADATRRVTGPFPYPNALALYLTPLIVWLIGFTVKRAREKKTNFIALIFLVLTITSGLLAIYFTRSKGAMLAILAIIIFYALFYKNYRKFFIRIIGIAFVASLAIVLTYGVPNFKGSATVEGGDSVSTRLQMWQETWQMLKNKPILGAGLAGYQSAVEPFHKKDYIEIYLYPHNIFLNFYSEIGLLGLVGFVLIIIWFYKQGFSDENKNYSILAMASMTALLMHGLVDVPYFKNDLAILFWLLFILNFISFKSEKFGA